MYTMVLLMALNGSAAAPADCFGGGHGCYGGGWACHGGYGACHGCNGGGFLFGGHGCRGGHPLFGGHGCNGGGFLFGKHRGHGCNGGWACHGGHAACYGGYGACYGGHGACYGGYMGAPYGPPGPPPEKLKEPPVEKKPKGEGPAPATLIVSLPADATLTIEGTPTTSTSGVRVFTSPVLEPNKDYYYTLKAEVVVNGEPQTITKQVLVRAGEETRVTLEPTAASAAVR
jgi:uncharacterized protein (TIGR03000 family)